MTDTAALPAGADVQGVRFADPVSGSSPLAELPPPVRRQAVPASGSDAAFEVMTLAADHPEEADPGERMRPWVLAGGGGVTRYQYVAIHGAQVHWCPPRVAVAALPEVVDGCRRSLLELLYLDAELRAVEAGLADLWPAAEADAKVAFEFRERDLPRREEIGARFAAVVLLRSRLAKAMPPLLVPQLYPPTLPAQLHERLRERLGVVHRIESLETQLEMFERIYDACGNRASEYALSRKSLALEWVIIGLLAVQVVMTLVEMLSGTKS